MDANAPAGDPAPGAARSGRNAAGPTGVDPSRPVAGAPSGRSPAPPRAPATPRPAEAGDAASELPPGGANHDPALKSAGAWVQMLSRTLKTCRLYDATNPTVQRFREELAEALVQRLDEHGALTIVFTADAVTCDERTVYAARSREDNLAFAFYRDGVRGLTFQPGVDARECAALVDALLSVTGQNLDGDDLVTLLWEANLRHVDVDYIPAESAVGDATPAADGAGPLLPWPTADEAQDPDQTAEPAAGAAAVDGERSEDWALGESTDVLEATFTELDFMAAQETARFMEEYAAERNVPPATAALAVVNACLNTATREDDRRELGRFLPRVLRATLSAGAWGDAREALRMVREIDSNEWSDETFTQELLQPVSVTRTVEKLDQQGPASVAEFIQLANDLGPAALDWLTLALSESQTRMTRQLVAEAITLLAQEDPTRLAPWLSDPRWYVVRNVVHLLGWIGGPAVVPLLLTAVRYPDARVVGEVVAALQGIELRLARPVLIKAIEGADSRLFCQILQQLSAARDPAVARYMTAFLAQERFLQRPPEERRAVYAAIASTGGDESVPDLELALTGGNWFDREQELHRHAVARCLVRIATPRALQVLEAGAQSRRAPVRQACTAALATRMAA